MSTIYTKIKSLNTSLAKIISRAIEILYFPPISKLIKAETLRYGVCGVANYILLDATLYYIIYHYIVGLRYIELPMVVISPHVASLIIVFPITFLSGFWLNRYVAFGATQPRAIGQIIRYGITVVGSIILSYVTLKFLVEGLGVWATPAKVASSLITATYSYLMARCFTFTK